MASPLDQLSSGRRFNTGIGRLLAAAGIIVLAIMSFYLKADADRLISVKSTNLSAGPGSISITGGEKNGSDHVSGLNGIYQDALNPLAYGLKADGRTVYDGMLVRNSDAVTSNTADFSRRRCG